MKDMIPAFRKLDNGEILLIGYQRVNCHMIFDFKMEYFCCKASLLSGRHMIEHPSTITYEIVVSRETSGIALTLSDLNDFLAKLLDNKNTYITATVIEKI